MCESEARGNRSLWRWSYSALNTHMGTWKPLSYFSSLCLITLEIYFSSDNFLLSIFWEGYKISTCISSWTCDSPPSAPQVLELQACLQTQLCLLIFQVEKVSSLKFERWIWREVCGKLSIRLHQCLA